MKKELQEILETAKESGLRITENLFINVLANIKEAKNNKETKKENDKK